MADDGLVDRVLDQVVDRLPVDWEAVTPQPEVSDSVGEDDADALAMLRLLDELGAVNQAFQRGEFRDFPSLDQLGGDAAQTAVTADLPASRVARQQTESALASEAEERMSSWGRYRLEEQIGRGGFGAVYRGWDPVLQMPVAIKILHRRHSDDRLAERLIREGQLLAQVKHPHVVRVLNVERHDGRVGLVMEYLRGETLDQMLTARGLLNHRETTVIAEDVCRALSAVHAVGLVHRDVKARNIMREHDGRIVLMDFGAGMPLDTAPGESGIVGTPVYMAPEVLRGAQATIASDVYAVGVLLFYLVTRRYPYEGHTVDDIRSAHTSGRRQFLLELRTDLPQAYVKVVERALSPDPRERFASPGALLQALLDARTTVRDWRQVAVQAAAGIAGLAVTLTIGGAITSGVFNAALGRQAYATEGVVEWFVLGRRSMLLPLLLTLLAVGALGLLLALRNVLLPILPAARAAEEAALRRSKLWSDRLGVFDPFVAAGWLVLVTGVVLIAIWVHWSALLSAVTSSISTAPASVLAVLGPSSQEYQTNYRMALALLATANGAGWYGLWRFAVARGLKLPSWLLPTQAALLMLVYGSLQVTYRLVYDNDEFARASWQGQQCYALGERATDVLLFCPAVSPRISAVEHSAVTADPSAPAGSLFTEFERFSNKP